MNCQSQPEHDAWRAIVLSRGRTEVLLKISERGLLFPSLEIPRRERRAENLTRALKRDWGCDAVCLFTPDSLLQNGNAKVLHYELMESWCDQHIRGTDWRPILSLAAGLFQDEAEFPVLEHCLHELEGYERDPDSPFAKREWLAHLREWATHLVRGVGLELTGELRQHNASPTFNLIRFETSGPAIWFKAVGKPNLREYPITLKLADLFPRFLPEILGTKPEWNAWLSREVEGTCLGETKDIPSWKKAAADLGRLQIESISRTDSLLDSGAHDLRTNKLLASIDPFFDFVAHLMEEQRNVSPPTLSGQDLSLLGLRIKDSISLLEDLRIPNTLGHLDLNPWNVMISASGPVFLDWAEAYLGPPFFSLDYLLQHFRREFGANAVLEPELVNAYKALWRQLLSQDLISEALALTPLAAVFAYAVGTGVWKEEERLRDPKTAAHFRSLARRMNREAIRFIERRPACLS